MQEKEQLVSALVESFRLFGREHWGTGTELAVKPSQMMVLYYLKKNSGRAEGLKQSELSRTMRLAPCTVTPLLNSLEKEGYINRRHSSADRRVVYIALTDKGNGFIEQMRAKFLSIIGGFVDHLGLKDAAELVRLLKKLEQYLNFVQK
ncbi:MAG: MarR family transcriptional regulator [Bacillota bacterium]|nr:MarR family transcriptional regulator [Bacillota bacterium]